MSPDPVSTEEYFRGTLKVIAHWSEVDLSGEWETGLRGVIRSITDMAREVLSAHPEKPAGCSPCSWPACGCQHNPGAAMAEPATVAADLDGGNARPNRRLDSSDRGHTFHAAQPTGTPIYQLMETSDDHGMGADLWMDVTESVYNDLKTASDMRSRIVYAAQPPAASVFPKWCPGCSREVEGVCHHFNCAVGLDAAISKPPAEVLPTQHRDASKWPSKADLEASHSPSSAGRESAADTEMYRLRDLIASHITCEDDCQKMPTGCGCALTAARAIMNGGPQTSDWQPMETFPENEEDYLACDDRVAGGFYQVVYWDPEMKRFRVPDAGIAYDRGFFTHWRRLDLTPSDAKEIASLAMTQSEGN